MNLCVAIAKLKISWTRTYADKPGLLPRRRARAAHEANPKHEEAAMSVLIVNHEILFDAFNLFPDPFIYSSLTCEFKDLNLSRSEGVQCWSARPLPRDGLQVCTAPL